MFEFLNMKFWSSNVVWLIMSLVENVLRLRLIALLVIYEEFGLRL